MNLVTSGVSSRSYLAPVVFGIVGIDVYLTFLLDFPGSEISQYLYGFGTFMQSPFFGNDNVLLVSARKLRFCLL